VLRMGNARTGGEQQRQQQQQTAAPLNGQPFSTDKHAQLTHPAPLRSRVRVLRAYAQLDVHLGFCEAIGLVAGLILKILPEFEAFTLFALLLRGENGPAYVGDAQLRWP
jgi:hypothetical protein